MAIACSARPVAIRGRAPMRSLRMPATGATNIGMIVQGRTRRPDCSGESPCVVWKNCESRKIEPKTPKNIASDTPLVVAKPRLRKKRSGSIGALARASHATKAASRTTPAPSAPMIVADAPAGARARGGRAGLPARRLAGAEAVDEAEQAGAGQADAGQVEPVGRATRL